LSLIDHTALSRDSWIHILRRASAWPERQIAHAFRRNASRFRHKDICSDELQQHLAKNANRAACKCAAVTGRRPAIGAFEIRCAAPPTARPSTHAALKNPAQMHLNHRAFGSAAKKITAVGEQNLGHEIERWNNPTNAPRRCSGAICVRYGRASI